MATKQYKKVILSFRRMCNDNNKVIYHSYLLNYEPIKIFKFELTAQDLVVAAF